MKTILLKARDKIYEIYEAVMPLIIIAVLIGVVWFNSPTLSVVSQGIFCRLGSGFSCLSLGLKEPLSSKAYEYFKSSCEYKEGDGCYLQGVLIARGASREENILSSKEIFFQGCKYGSVKSCQRLGLRLERNYKDHIDKLTKECESNGQACNAAGNYCMLSAEDGMSKFTRQFYTKSCRSKYLPGCNNLALYLQMENRESRRSLWLFEIACSGGIQEGCMNSAWVYEFGKGVRQNYEKAKERYGELCDSEFPGACESYARVNSLRYHGP